MRDKNRDASNNSVNWKDKLDKVKEIAAKFNEISISSPSDKVSPTGKGITEYLNTVINELQAGAKDINLENFTTVLREKINGAINKATTTDVITDTKRFKDQMNTALTQVFGNIKFDIDFS